MDGLDVNMEEGVHRLGVASYGVGMDDPTISHGRLSRVFFGCTFRYQCVNDMRSKKSPR